MPKFPETPLSTSQLVVVGAHLSGFPLNHQLMECGATFNRTTTTSSTYRLYEIPSSNGIRKPGLKRIVDDTTPGCCIEVEVWNIANEGLGKFLGLIMPPLAIGSVELYDGTWQKGFVCEPWGLENSLDITASGGWRAHIRYLEAIKETPKPSTEKDGKKIHSKESSVKRRASRQPRGDQHEDSIKTKETSNPINSDQFTGE